MKLDTNSDFAGVDALLTHYIDSNQLSGVVAAITDGSRIQHRFIYGYQDQELGSPMAWDSIFRIYSMTKPITSVAAMMLWEQGKFNLDDPISTYLPSFKSTKILNEDGTTHPANSTITVRHILCHTAGITLPAFSDDHLAPLYLEKQLDGMRSKGNLSEIIDKLGAMPVKHEPGSKWAYSMATDVAARLVEIWSGISFEKFITTNILLPLGMTDTAFQISKANTSRITTNYNVEDGLLSSAIDTGGSSRFLNPPEFACGSGGLTSTADDYLQFMQMLLKEGEHNGVRILKPETLQEMTRNHLPTDMENFGAKGFGNSNWEGIGFGLGFSVITDGEKTGIPQSLSEYGWTGAAGTAFFINPRLGLGAILLTQYMPSDSYPLRKEFREAIYGEIIL